MSRCSSPPRLSGGILYSLPRNRPNASCKSAGGSPWCVSMKCASSDCVRSALSVDSTVWSFTSAKKNVVLSWQFFMYLMNAATSSTPGNPTQCDHTSFTNCFVAVEVRFEHQVSRLQVLLARRMPDKHDVVHHHQARQVRARYLREGALVIARQIAQIPAQLHRVANVQPAVFQNRRQNREPVSGSALVRHIRSPPARRPSSPDPAPL